MNTPLHACVARQAAFRAVAVFAAAVVAGVAQAAQQDVTVVQSIALSPGWNAVYLELDPADPAPGRVFAGLPVDAVATHDAVPAGGQFVKNPGVDLALAQGWAVWYAPSRPDAFLSNLYEMQGAKAYLVHATTNATLALVGNAPPALPTWKPDAFNFVGFPLQDPGSPTFAQFFAGSPAHTSGRIYRLVEGKYPGFSLGAEALFNAARIQNALGSPAEAQITYGLIVSQYPQSAFAASAREAVARLSGRPAASPPAPMPSEDRLTGGG